MNGGTSRRGKRSKGQSSREMPVIQVGTDGASRHAALHQFGGLDQYALNNSTPIAASSIAFATPGTIGNTQQENAQNVPNLSDTGGEIQEFLQKMHANIDAKLEETWKRIIASETRLELMMERKMDMLLENTSGLQNLHEGLTSLTGQIEVSAHQNAQANIMNRQAHQNITLEEHAQRIFKVESQYLKKCSFIVAMGSPSGLLIDQFALADLVSTFLDGRPSDTERFSTDADVSDMKNEIRGLLFESFKSLRGKITSAITKFLKEQCDGWNVLSVMQKGQEERREFMLSGAFRAADGDPYGQPFYRKLLISLLPHLFETPGNSNTLDNLKRAGFQAVVDKVSVYTPAVLAFVEIMVRLSVCLFMAVVAFFPNNGLWCIQISLHIEGTVKSYGKIVNSTGFKVRYMSMMADVQSRVSCYVTPLSVENLQAHAAVHV